MKTDIGKLVAAYRLLTGPLDGCPKLELTFCMDSRVIAEACTQYHGETHLHIEGASAPTAAEAIDNLKSAIDDQIKARVAQLEAVLTEFAPTAKV